MTGLEHYRAAEGLLAEAGAADGDGYSADRDPVRHQRLLLEAQTHALLAVAAVWLPDAPAPPDERLRLRPV